MRAQEVQGGEADALARGQASFNRVCGRCHPHGRADVGRRLIGLGWPEARVRTQVRHGRGTMRPISTARLSDADLADVIVYLRSIGTVR
jgi:mono/diheme cytochrome c family protein